MADIATEAFDAIRASLADVQAQIRYAGTDDTLDGTVEEAICTGIEQVRQHTEEGLYSGQQGIVRYKLDDEPAAWSTVLEAPAIMGQVVEILLPGQTDDWIRARVRNRLVMAGSVRLDVIAEFEEQ